MKNTFYFFVTIISLSQIGICESNKNYIAYSFAYTGDNNSYIDESNDNKNIHCGLLSSYFTYIFNDKYHLSLNYKYNKELINDYMLPEKGEYGYISFSYHIKERNKFPLNISFGLSLGNFLNNDYISNSLEFKIYKRFDSNFYPFSLSYLMSKNNSHFNKLNINQDYSHTMSSVGFHFILNVDSNINTPSTDNIFIGFAISNIKNDYFGSISIGTSHVLE